MPTIRSTAEPLASFCTSVPPAQKNVGQRCHNCPNEGWSLCWSCAHVEQQVTRPCPLVVPVSLYAIPSQLHHYLNHYKNDRSSLVQRDFSVKTIAILAHFLLIHEECIAAVTGGSWDTIASVPSTGSRSGEHPLRTALRWVPALDGRGPLSGGK